MRLATDRGWRIVRSAGSPRVLAPLGLPLVFVAALVAAGRLDGARALAAWSVRAWELGLGGALLCSIASAVRARSAVALLGWSAALCLLVQPAVWSAGRLEGRLDLGEHEEDAPWRALARGALALVPVISVGEVALGEDGGVDLNVDGRVRHVQPGRRADLGAGLTVVVRGPYPAPLCVVARRDGTTEVEGFVKLSPGSREYLGLGVLPHRLYVSVPTGQDSITPTKLHLRVQRGKTRLLERDVSDAEEVEFEGLRFRFTGGPAWLRVDVRREPRSWLLGVAALLASAAGALAWRARRSAS